MTLGQRPRAITTPPPYSHCQMYNPLGKDQDSLTSDPFPSGGRQEGCSLQGGWEGSHTTLDTGRRHDSVESNNFMTQGSTRSIITWAPLPSKPPGDDAGGHKWRPHKQGVCLTAEELPSVWWGSCAKAAKLWPEGNLIYYTGSRCYTDFLHELVWNKSHQGLYS